MFIPKCVALSTQRVYLFLILILISLNRCSLCKDRERNTTPRKSIEDLISFFNLTNHLCHSHCKSLHHEKHSLVSEETTQTQLSPVEFNMDSKVNRSVQTENRNETDKSFKVNWPEVYETTKLVRSHSESNLRRPNFMFSVSMKELDQSDTFTVSFDGDLVNISSSSKALAQSNSTYDLNQTCQNKIPSIKGIIQDFNRLAKILNPDTASIVDTQEVSTTEDDDESFKHGLENENISENLILQYDKELDEEVEKLTFGQCGEQSTIHAFGDDIVDGEEDFEANPDDKSRSQKFARCRTMRNFQLIESAPEQVSKGPFNYYVRVFVGLFEHST